MSHSTIGQSPVFDRALNESWPPDAGTTPDRPQIPVVARVVWRRAGEEQMQGSSATDKWISPVDGPLGNEVIPLILRERAVDEIPKLRKLQIALLRHSGGEACVDVSGSMRYACHDRGDAVELLNEHVVVAFVRFHALRAQRGVNIRRSPCGGHQM